MHHCGSGPGAEHHRRAVRSVVTFCFEEENSQVLCNNSVVCACGCLRVCEFSPFVLVLPFLRSFLSNVYLFPRLFRIFPLGCPGSRGPLSPLHGILLSFSLAERIKAATVRGCTHAVFLFLCSLTTRDPACTSATSNSSLSTSPKSKTIPRRVSNSNGVWWNYSLGFSPMTGPPVADVNVKHGVILQVMLPTSRYYHAIISQLKTCLSLYLWPPCTKTFRFSSMLFIPCTR